MKILLTNDDGVQAPGLAELARVLAEIADIFVVAPDRNRSGASNSLTLSRPLRIYRQDNGFISVQGTPTDCVHMAITGLLDVKPDLVVSGINAGSNLGDDIWYSGTVAAAIEGRFLGCPSIAISLASKNHYQQKHYDTAAQVAKDAVLRLAKDPLPSNTMLNINVPDLALADLKGYEVARLGTRHASEPIIKELDPRGQEIYWVGLPGHEQDAGLGTDFYAVNMGKVSITPLLLDLTHYKVFDQIGRWADGLNAVFSNNAV